MVEGRRAGWWSTLPGVMTAIAALITAATGLLLGLNQVGWLSASSTPQTSAASTRVPSVPGLTPSPSVAAASGSAQVSGAPSSATSGYKVSIPLNREFRVGDISYEVLAATARPDADGKLALVMSVRGRSYRAYDANFWDASFAVTVGEDVVPASGGLDELLHANATQRGDVLFVVPADTRDAVLTLRFQGGETRTVPFRISPIP
ncbi:hypothetical protein ACFUC1_06405 [Pedococcus sp. NPDC057267]|uniref:hypothetical protein n=1 Tax=Pedococcus sp. NPDC057267 TaxID=3346077 RepID=UPI003640712B